MKVATIIHTHKNSNVFKDTFESVNHYLSDWVLIAIDGQSFQDFENENYFKLCGFNHGLPSAPYRNVCLSLMQAWNTWGESADWYCYMEYDCLIGSSEIFNHLKLAKELDIWILGNDYRISDQSIEIINLITNKNLNLHYLLGCCVFYNSIFLKRLHDENFFERFLHLTNEYPREINFNSDGQKKRRVYDLSEFLYPTLAVSYGGKIQELASWDRGYEEVGWKGNFEFYPMRFRPDLLLEDPYQNACVMHPIKNFDNPIREYHRQKRTMS
jgi:hypothetical protein